MEKFINILAEEISKDRKENNGKEEGFIAPDVLSEGTVLVWYYDSNKDKKALFMLPNWESYTEVRDKAWEKVTGEIRYAFEGWYNGPEWQMTPLYAGVEAQQFIERHYNSGTFANLFMFDNREDAVKEYEFRRNNM